MWSSSIEVYAGVITVKDSRFSLHALYKHVVILQLQDDYEKQSIFAGSPC
jgi:hypothetical protein